MRLYLLTVEQPMLARPRCAGAVLLQRTPASVLDLNCTVSSMVHVMR